MGGTFDPIHNGHLICAEQAREQFDLDYVVFMPTGNPAFKQSSDVSPAEDRFHMVRIAIRKNVYFDVSRLEVDREGVTYTVDTLRELRRLLPMETELFFITGADAILSVLKWRDVEEAVSLASFVAATRPGYDYSALREEIADNPNFANRISFFEVPGLAISSTDLRARVRAGKSITYMTPVPVASYISSQRLYTGGSVRGEVPSLEELDPGTRVPSLGKGAHGRAAVGKRAERREHDAAGVAGGADAVGGGACVVSSGSVGDGCAADGFPLRRPAVVDDLEKEGKRIKAVEHKIFFDSDIPEIPVEQIADELSEGLDQADHDFILAVLPALKDRLSSSRYAHSVSVSRTCRRLAKLYDANLSQAARAGLLHDWDKCYKGQQVFDRVTELGLELPENYELLMPIFHSITGAKALSIRFPELEPEVLNAVERHTSGAVDMQPLDMIVYISDMLEPLRRNPDIEWLREMIGEVSLSDLFCSCYEASIKNLIDGNRSLHPDTARVWNTWVVPFENAKREQQK